MTRNKAYVLYNVHGRLYSLTHYSDNEKDIPINAVLLTPELEEVFTSNPHIILDYVYDGENIIYQSEFDSPVDTSRSSIVTDLVRVAEPEDADVILDGDQLILQRSSTGDPVRITLVRTNGVPIVTVDLDQPITVNVQERVLAKALSGGVSTFYQRLQH
jgi:hypothetical protein